MSDDKPRKRGKLKNILAGIAPQLAHALGGPLAGAAVSQISRVILGSPDGDDQVLIDAIERATPEQLVELQKAEQEFQLALRHANLEEQRIDAADRGSARRRQVDMQDWTPSVIGALIILGFFIVLGAMVARRLPEGTETEFSIMLGALATMTAAVVNYFFGSSAGSKEKTRLMALDSKPGANAQKDTAASIGG